MDIGAHERKQQAAVPAGKTFLAQVVIELNHKPLPRAIPNFLVFPVPLGTLSQKFSSFTLALWLLRTPRFALPKNAFWSLLTVLLN